MTSPVRRMAGAATLTLVTTVVLAGCSGGADDTEPVADQSSTSPSPSTDSSSPTSQPTDEPTDSPSDGSGEGSGARAVPVYFAGDTASGRPHLFREFHRVTGDRLTEAARLVAGGGDPLDPDYRTLWPQMEISSVTATDGLIVVVIPSDAFTERPDAMTRREARLAIQQLVYTLQGVQQERLPLQIKRDGSDFRLFGLPTDVPYTAASALRTLNLVNITSPAEGDTVTGDTVKVTGVANSFEASGPCRLVVDGKEVALEAYQADGWMEDRLFPFEVELPLADAGTGDVVVRCETDDPSGGAEGNGPAVDTKLIRVR